MCIPFVYSLLSEYSLFPLNKGLFNLKMNAIQNDPTVIGDIFEIT